MPLSAAQLAQLKADLAKITADINALVADPVPLATGNVIVGTYTGDTASVAVQSLQAVGADPAKSACQMFGWNPETTQAAQSVIADLALFPGVKIWCEHLCPSGAQDGSVLAGTYDAYYFAAAKAAWSAGVDIIRLGWEFNNTGQPWSRCRAQWFVANWRHIVAIYESVSVGFSFVFNPDKGLSSTQDSIMSYYPGKAYMGSPGIVAMDAYTSNEAPSGAGQLTWFDANTTWNSAAVVSLAQANGHETAFMEWSTRSDQYGDGLDDGPYVTACMAWATAAVQTTGRNSYLMMWNDGYPTVNSAPSWTFLNNPNMKTAMAVAVSAGQKSGVIAP